MARAGRLRVIAGSAGGRRLVAPRGGARPTTDRVKESVFAGLGDARMTDATVLDLYAGSGALAIEALSRGAAGAVLVEMARDAVSAITANLESTGFADRARVETGPVGAFLRRGVPAEAPFDLAFLDPPYETPAADVAEALTLLTRPGWLALDAAIVLEQANTPEEHPVVPPGWAITWQRAYGDTLVTVATAHS
jgi:16S rRNA (guanine966-N2)-methyltransferase